MTEERKPLPPYLPYKSFLGFLATLKAIGVPSHIDKSVMSSMSGAMQSWTKAALRVTKLIDADDVASPRLKQLVASDGPDRQRLLKELFESTYTFLGSLDLTNTTPQKLRAAFIDLGSQGETVEKMVAFMIALAKDAGVPLSKLLTTRAATPRRPRASKLKSVHNGDAHEDEHGDDDPTSNDQTSMKTLTLPHAGGTLTLSGNFNLFELDGDERALVFDIIDKMKAFEKSGGGGDE